MARASSRTYMQAIVVPPQRALVRSVSLYWYCRWPVALARVAVHILANGVSLAWPVRQAFRTSTMSVEYQPYRAAQAAPSVPAVRRKLAMFESLWIESLSGPTDGIR